ncbi:hypothetical protein FISHEDRAFT_46406 [Fistulina hepatica ATCC 64428]|uniref:BTB domain-containing protein n=1 Tax=Fistulina hepatica ATCC 64428 TaxID=1128425 RepID=A0A0D7AAB1_9AGAR|nr:hypothetical protein FISHEDRAFT_46406 [Fistulina hepatica ATCC 64428]
MDSQALSDAKRSSKFWFHDGTLIIHAEDTMFRVHSGVLSKHSSFFDGMIGSASPDAGMQIDGCPVVDVTDPLDEWDMLLSVLYDPLRLLTLDQIGVSERAIKILRLLLISTKYEFSSFRARALHVLESFFPTTLDAAPGLFFPLERPVVAVLMRLRSSNASIFLPYFFYRLSRVEEGYLLELPENMLSWQDKAVLLAGRLQVQHHMRLTSFQFLFESKPVPECTCKYSSPRPRFPPIRRDILNGGGLADMTGFIGRLGNAGFCESCVRAFQTSHKEGRQALWDMLPGLFRLGTWEDLRADQTADNPPATTEETSTLNTKEK